MSNSETAALEKKKTVPFWHRKMPYSNTVLLVLLLWVGLSSATCRPRSTGCGYHAQATNNLMQIGLAILNYTVSRPDGKFPPAQVADEEGGPKHSWRVLILRELEREDLYEAYDFDKPWDDPENLKLIERMPSVYASPFDRNQEELGLTPYQAVSAPGTVMGTTRAARLDDLSRSKSPRIMIVADFDNPVPWTKPEDISPAEIISRLQQFKRHSPSRFQVVWSDGSVKAIDDEMTVEELGKSF